MTDERVSQPNKDVGETFEEWKSKQDGYHVLLLRAYIHSGVSLSLSDASYPFNDRWDSCWVGAVFVDKQKARTRKKAAQLAEDLIDSWNDYLSGNVYGNIVEKTEDSCWGFLGDYRENGMLNQAKSAIDSDIRNTLKSHNQKLKAYIRNAVPLEKRKPLTL